jgi:tocopherol cyclase
MMKQLFLALLFFIPLSLMAQSDPWNTYQWNRKNIQAGNGVVDKTLWYEWWYYKIVIPGTGKSYFFVYGVVNPWDLEQKSKGTRSYVGMGDFANKDQVEEQFNVSDFSASYSETYVVINRNTATDKFFNGSLKNEQGETYEWDVKISKHWAYNAEGWMMGSMITDIEWYPAQASASCTGSVTTRGEKTTFKDVPCYQDRNWGKSFPDWWTWIVSNHFEGHPGTALAVGGGKPKVRGTRTPIASVSIGLTHEGKDYSFRPVDMQLVSTDVNFGKWKVWAMGKKYKIEVEAYAPKEEFMDLQFVTPSGEIFHDYETLTGQLRVKLYERNGIGLKLIADLVSSYAGIEFGSTENYREKLLESFGPDKETPIILHSL